VARTGKGRFIWPVSGRVVSGYGPKGEGLHNDGINISAPRGAQVRAAGAGVVAYAGNELRGFGNLLLIRHAGGWVTAYAHNAKLLVRRGQKVSQGQLIARVGSTGSVIKPQLHFEIRRGRRAINPARQLAAAPAAS
jgi:murein DD-endopeptidase MepM/ murein hydrolase activator NlpD